MAQWKTQNIGLKLDAIASLGDSVSPLFDVIKTAIDVNIAAVNIQKALFISSVNPILLALNSAVDAVLEEINNLKSIEVKYLSVLPGDVSNPRFGVPILSAETIVNTVIKEFDDPGDANRPQFNDNSSVGGIFVIISADFSADSESGDVQKIFKSFFELLSSLNTLLNIPELGIKIEDFSQISDPPEKNLRFKSLAYVISEGGFNVGDTLVGKRSDAQGIITEKTDNLNYKIKVDRYKGKFIPGEFVKLVEEQYTPVTQAVKYGIVYDAYEANGKSIPPDWGGVKMTEIVPAIGDFLTQIEGFLEGLKGLVKPNTAVFDKMISFLEEIKTNIEEVQKILDELFELLNINVSASAGISINVLDIPIGKGGNEYLKKQINSTEIPSILTENPDTQISAGFIFVGDEISIGGIKTLLGL